MGNVIYFPKSKMLLELRIKVWRFVLKVWRMAIEAGRLPTKIWRLLIEIWQLTIIWLFKSYDTLVLTRREDTLKVEAIYKESLLSLFQKHGDQFLKHNFLPFLHFDERSVIRQTCKAIQYFTPPPNFVYVRNKLFAVPIRLEQTSGFVDVRVRSDDDTIDLSIFSEMQTGVIQVIATISAFAALKEDGTLITWGNTNQGGDCSYVNFDPEAKIIKLFNSLYSFAALDSRGRVCYWGSENRELNRNTHEDMEFVLNSLESGVIDIQSTDGSFAALKSNGQVVRWGNLGWGPKHLIPEIQSGVQSIYSNNFAYCALKTNGQVINWYPWFEYSPALSAFLEKDVVEIQTIPNCGFRAIKANGFSIQWGNFTPPEEIDNGMIARFNDSGQLIEMVEIP